ncbi:unnamed protein product [Closterium sp. NIES-54]
MRLPQLRAALEAKCPGIACCADIVTLATRDGVHLAGGPYMRAQLGHHYSHTSKAALAVKLLPGHQMNVNEFLGNFAAINLTLVDLVALSDAHTIGESGCDKVAHRLVPNHDNSLARLMREFLNSHCKAPNVDSNVSMVFYIHSGARFDNHYFKNIQRKFGLQTSDQALTVDLRTKELVDQFATDKKAFFRHFHLSMLCMGAFGVLTGQQGEIHRICSVVN